MTITRTFEVCLLVPDGETREQTEARLLEILRASRVPDFGVAFKRDVQITTTYTLQDDVGEDWRTFLEKRQREAALMRSLDNLPSPNAIAASVGHALADELSRKFIIGEGVSDEPTMIDKTGKP